MSIDFDKIKILEFQQPLRCCNVTALAYALSALGYATTVDDIFYRFWKCPIASMYQACVDEDSSSLRSRGMIVVEQKI
ncbi:MAG: hypothetical protein HC930_02185 [Hydrococcus sp. SU_1_0]|nr:hypothetical protein [Hydrococcus sp. SU_1_0]